MESNNLLYALTDEFDYLAGRGATLERLGRLPTLGKLANSQGDPRQKGLIARRFLWFELECVDHPIRFKGMEYSVSCARKAWVANLDLEDTGFDAPYRRSLVLDSLGLWKWSVEWWRKGPEWGFLNILASGIVEGSAKTRQ